MKYAEENKHQISITLDYNKEEKDKQKILVRELKEKRSNGDYNWCTKNNELCHKQKFSKSRNLELENDLISKKKNRT